jgi:putative spermidine/putrescine transport system permease protein
MAETARIAPAPTAPALRSLGRFWHVRPGLANVMLVTPALLLMFCVFLVPLGMVLLYSVRSTEVQSALPRTAAYLSHWDGETLPDEAAFATLATDLLQPVKGPQIPKAATRLNSDIAGFRSMLLKTAAQIKDIKPPYRDGIIGIDPHWGDVTYWRVLKSDSRTFTAGYLFAAADFRLAWDGSLSRDPALGLVYTDAFIRTFWISFVITATCVVLGYPLAFAIATASQRTSRLLLLAVLLPFWTSLLVRTSAWTILLQQEGIINGLLLWAGVIKAPLELIFNRFGVYVTLTHILLPFMVLPVYSVMKSIPPEQLRAAYSLGGRPMISFLLVYLPQSMPGLIAGAVLVYVIATGFYIAPALVGGGGDQMIGYLVAYHGMNTANWGMASSLSIILLLSILILFLLTRKYWRSALFTND